ncbi:MAG: HK97 family phage prohead protease, partial [Pseudomonadota bacterium]
EKSGAGRLLLEIDLWEVSLVTFPMLPDARIAPKPGDDPTALAASLADLFSDARKQMA